MHETLRSRRPSTAVPWRSRPSSCWFHQQKRAPENGQTWAIALLWMPTNGSNFGYVSPSVQKTLHDVQLASLKQDKNLADPSAQKLIETLSNLSQQGEACSVTQETPEGWVGVTHGNVDPAAQLATVGVVIPAAIVASLAVPATMNATKRGQAVAIKNDLRLIDAALNQWATEQKKAPGTQPTTDDIKPYLKNIPPLYKRLDSAPGATSFPAGITGIPNIVLPPLGSKLVVPQEIVQKFQGACTAGFWSPYQP